MKKNALVICRSTAHFPYIISICDALLAKGFSTTIAFDQHWSEKDPNKSEGLENWLSDNNDAKACWYPKRKTTYLSRVLLVCRELRSFGNYCRRGSEYEFYRNRWLGYLFRNPAITKLCNKIIIRNLLGSRAVDSFFRMVEQLFQPVDDIDSWLEEITPDLVLVTPLNLRFSGETDLVKSLLKMKIPYCVLTLTWDNLSTKGIFQFQPEKLLVWNKEQSEDAKFAWFASRKNRHLWRPVF